MVRIQEDRKEEYHTFISRQIEGEGLTRVDRTKDYYVGQNRYKIFSHGELRTRRFFGRTVASIVREPDLSPKEHDKKSDELEINLLDLNYEPAIIRIANSVRERFGVEPIITKHRRF